MLPFLSLQRVGKFFSPLGRTTQWYLCKGSWLLRLATEKGSWRASSGWSGMLKKQSFTSMVKNGHSLGIIEREGCPSWSGPISSMTSLILLRSWSNLQLEGFLWITNTGGFQGRFLGLMGSFCNCSFTECFRTLIFFSSRGHWSAHTGSFFFQVNFRVRHPREKASRLTCPKPESLFLMALV